MICHLSFQTAVVWSTLLFGFVQPKKCHRDCRKLGNCNLDTGECQCPFGREGAACEIDHLSACRPDPEGPAYCEHVMLKPCQCYRQCKAYTCNTDEGHCHPNFDLLRRDGLHTCYERPALGDAQVADQPAEEEPDVLYYRGFEKDAKQNLTYKEAQITNRFAEKNLASLPLSQCSEQCHKRGACVTDISDPNYQPYCRCMYGSEGASCEVTRSDSCPNKCSGRGECKEFFCHCKPPYWGMACERSTPHAPDPEAILNPADFRIYMYDLPTSIAYQPSYWAGWAAHDPIYMVGFYHFFDNFISSSVRTENPDEAHMFFVPGFFYAHSGNVGSPDPAATHTLRHIKATYPYWNRAGGRDHFLFTTGDRASCYLQYNESKSVIKLSHFGYYDRKTMDHSMVLPSINAVTQTPDWGCFHPIRDVVVPPFGLGLAEDAIDTYLSDPKSLPARGKLLFFAGGIRANDPEYAGGTRLILHQWVQKWNDPEITSVEGFVDDYSILLRSHKFCLAPYGHGWGIRLLSAMANGCIPLIIQEHVFQPLEDVLPYEEFSVRLNNNDIPKIPEILRAITPDQLILLQKGVKTYWPAFIWHLNNDKIEPMAMAFEYTIMALRRRYMNSKSMYYGLHQPDLF